jgi:hypothetical protein
MNFRLSILAAVLWLAVAPARADAPAGDAFADRVVVAGAPAVLTADNTNVTREPGEPDLLPELTAGHTVWWSWTAPADGSLTLTVVGGAIRPFVAVFTGGSLDALSLVATNTGRFHNRWCQEVWVSARTNLTCDVRAGETYQIVADGIRGLPTEGCDQPLHIPFPPTPGIPPAPAPEPPAIPVPTGELSLALNFTPAPANDRFDARTRWTGNSVTSPASNAGATREAGEPLHDGNPGGSSVWYSWTAPADGVAMLGTNLPPVYAEPSWKGEWLGSPEVRWDQYGGGSGSVDAQILWPIRPIEIWPFWPFWSDLDAPPPFSPVFAVYTGDRVDALTPVAAGAAPRFRVTAGTEYAIAFDGDRGTEGTVTLHLQFTPRPPNDDFAAAIVVAGNLVDAAGHTVGAAREAGEPEHGVAPGGPSVWWRWTAPWAGWAELSPASHLLPQPAFGLAVFTGEAATNLKAVATSAVEASGGGVSSTWPRFFARPGVTYHLLVADTNAWGGAYAWRLMHHAAPEPAYPEVRADGQPGLVFAQSQWRAGLVQFSLDGVTYFDAGSFVSPEPVRDRALFLPGLPGPVSAKYRVLWQGRPLPEPTLGGPFRRAEGGFEFVVRGVPGQTVLVERSEDLAGWTRHVLRTLDFEAVRLQSPGEAAPGAFFRVQEAPLIAEPVTAADLEYRVPADEFPPDGRFRERP